LHELFKEINHLQLAGAKPHFVNENNALRAAVKPLKFNYFNGLAVSTPHLRGVLHTPSPSSAPWRQWKYDRVK